jgi:hypothetical protein
VLFNVEKQDLLAIQDQFHELNRACIADTDRYIDDAVMTRVAGVVVVALATGLCVTMVTGAEPRLKDVIALLESYLVRYETQLVTLIAQEQYEQWIEPTDGASPAARRTLTSDFGFLRLPGRPEWLGVRDTFSLDGQPIPEHERRLDRLFADGSSDVHDLARHIVEENTRYNLGIIVRTINVPMLALDLLGSRNHDRLSFHKRGEERLEGRAVWVVAFTERERPTLVKTPDGRNRAAHGTVWIDPGDGAVLRTALEFDAAGDSPATSITVVYHHEDTLGLLVPYEMRELYRLKARGDPPAEIHAVARYADFRQFRTAARIVPR